MASTIIQFDLPEELLPVLAILAAAETGLVAPDAAGYIVDSGASAWQYSITVPEACVGIYRINVWDGDGITVGQGWVWIEANDTGTYIADGSFAIFKKSKQDAQDGVKSDASSIAANAAATVGSINADATQIMQQTNASTAATQSTMAPANTVAEFKADAQLGTASGGMVSNAAEIKAKTDNIGTLRSETRW